MTEVLQLNYLAPADEGWNFSEGRPPSDWGFSQDPSQDPNLVRLAEQQERRNEELTTAQQHAADLEAEIADLAREVELRQDQELALKEVSCKFAHADVWCLSTPEVLLFRNRYH